VNSSAAVAFDVPALVVAVTFTVPDPAGDVTTISVAESLLIVAFLAPKWTAVAPDRFVPWRVTLVPPVWEPLSG
jgi:hypothetical protein